MGDRRVGIPQDPNAAAGIVIDAGEKTLDLIAPAGININGAPLSSGTSHTHSGAYVATTTPWVATYGPMDAISASLSHNIFTAPFACTLVSLSLAPGGAVVASDVDYWEVTMRKYAAGAFVGNVATKTTKVTGGQAMTANLDWNYDAITFSATFKEFAKGDVLNLVFFKTGTTATLVRVGATLRFLPT